MASPGINLIHALGVAPLLAYTGYVGRQCASDDPKCNKQTLARLSMTLLVIAVLVLLFHTYLFASKMYARSQNSVSNIANNVRSSVNAVPNKVY